MNGKPRSLFHRDVVFDLAVGPLLDSLNLHDIFRFLIGPPVDDRLGFGWADLREGIQLLFARRIDVHLLAGGQLRG